MQKKEIRKPVWLDAEVHQDLKELAVKDGTSMIELIRQYVKHRKEQDQPKEFSAA